MAADELGARMAQKAKNKFQKHWDMGKYFYGQDDLDQAIKNFVLGFEEYSTLVTFECVYEENFDDDTKIAVLLLLIQVLTDLLRAFSKAFQKDISHKTILAYLLICQRKAIDYLSSLKSSFRANDLEIYQKSCDLLEVIELEFGMVANNLNSMNDVKEELAKIEKLIKSTKPEQTSDETLKKLRTSLRAISAKSCFPDFEATGGCFVATAAYSTSIHPDLDTFRQFRDRTLLTNPLGRVLVSVYYQVGPQLAQYVNRSFHIKKIVKFLLKNLAHFMRSHDNI
ncbi:CFI-box-CTERM domain-containing protein [Limnospira platensis]|uniref:CFI-box-CTERM domain-containing protein n=1 Tax=Limnospira platensis TaxID=118562 RepID=UPI0002804629|nr:hypothetical protein SPLC1_S201820 [Arthrospira platensis C1]UWU45776.1 hypothetical protein APLC1_0460 [Arthrospira platensis C1]